MSKPANIFSAATGSILMFPGFMALYIEAAEENGENQDQEGSAELTAGKP